MRLLDVVLFPAGKRYLLRDEFNDTLAAGAVNGTAATPGPGTRAVNDTAGTKLAIAAGTAVWTSSTANWDPGLVYSSYARVAGRLLLVKMQFTGMTNQQYGWTSSAIAGTGRIHCINMTTTPAYVIENAAIAATFTAVAATPYILAIVLRATGAHYFIKGGTFTDWTLLWVGATANAATVYVQLLALAATSNQATDYVRIPVDPWVPTPLASDSFNRANGALGTTDGLAVEEAGGGGLAWTNQIGTTEVVGNVAQATALIGGIALATVNCGTLDVLHAANLTRAGNDVGIIVRYADANNYVIGYHDGANARLDKVVAGATTNIITAVAAYAASAPLLIICEGTAFQLFYNNVKIGATTAIADAALQTSPLVGLYSTNLGNTQNNMQTWARGTGSEYSILDKY